MLRPRMYLELSKERWRFDVPVLAVELFGKPQPQPWFEGRGIEAVLAHDLRVVATFRSVAGTRMSPELWRVVEPALKTMEQVLAARLPEGVALHTHG